MRSLSLKKETVAELTAGELDAVVGGADVTGLTRCVCSGVAGCLTDNCLSQNACFTAQGCA